MDCENNVKARDIIREMNPQEGHTKQPKFMPRFRRKG